MNRPSRQVFWLIVSIVTAALAVSLLPYVISAPSDRSSSRHERGSGGHQMSSSPGAAVAPYDLQFIDTMMAHHRGAIDMARLAKAKAVHTELRAMAQEMAQAQEREIKPMMEWRDRWFKGQAQARDMELPGMRESMKDMDLEKLKRTNGKEFDLMFLDMMTPHHQGGIVMSEDAAQKAEHQEINQLANRIIEQQLREIDQMRKWKMAWTNGQDQPR
jgi:uncharacterized protein (DUF305 family)